MTSYEVVEHGKPLQKVIRETPKPKGTEVLLRVTRSGVCHSDLHIWERIGNSNAILLPSLPAGDPDCGPGDAVQPRKARSGRVGESTTA